MASPWLRRGRVARRIVTMFVVSALVPVCLIGAIALRDVREHLTHQVERHLQQELKSWSLAAVGRLQLVESHLRAAALVADTPQADVLVRTLLQQIDADEPAVLGVTAVDESGTSRSLMGPKLAPAETRAKAERLAGGATTASVAAAGLVLELATTSGRLAVLVNPSWLWDLADRQHQRGPTRVAVLDEHGELLVTDADALLTAGVSLKAVIGEEAVGHTTWQHDDRTWAITHRALPLGVSFGLPSLTVVFVRPADDVLAPVASFSRSLVLALVATLWLVALLSLRLIRLSLDPLGRLQDATRRLAERDLSTRVDITSDDEFEDLASAFNAMAHRLETQFNDLEAMYFGTLNALARTIDAKSSWTAGHSERVTALAVRIGEELGMSPSRLATLHRAGLLHDIGKLAIPGAVIDKDGPLTPRELDLMREHPSRGVRILEPITAYADLLPIVGQHHERFDGGGYPSGLRGEDIDLAARVLAVADSYDAMTSDRPYRPGLAAKVATEAILAGSGSQFDPSVVEAFLRVVARHTREAA